MIHHCKIHCHTMDISELENLNLMMKDKGKWLPFSILLETVNAVKMTTDEETEMTYGCSTIFTDSGETYIIDTSYRQFTRIWEKFINNQPPYLPPPTHPTNPPPTDIQGFEGSDEDDDVTEL